MFLYIYERITQVFGMLLKLLPILLNIQNFIQSIFSPYKEFGMIDNKNKIKKTFLNQGASLVISSKMDEKRKKTTALAKIILKKYLNNPHLLIKFIATKGTKIVVVPNIDKAFHFAKEEEGFMPALTGLRALKLSIIINLLGNKEIKIGFKTPEMLIMKSNNPSIYLLAHQFHHWLAYKNHLPGYDQTTMNIFKNVWNTNPNKVNFKKLSINEILSLKDAVERDKEAIDFVREFVREQIGAKEMLGKVKDGKLANI